jgi:hypothetical protein
MVPVEITIALDVQGRAMSKPTAKQTKQAVVRIATSEDANTGVP